MQTRSDLFRSLPYAKCLFRRFIQKVFFCEFKTTGYIQYVPKNAMTASGRGEIFSPFGPHMLLHVHYLKLYEEYDIIYVSENELDNINVNYLHFATKSQNRKELASHFNVTMNDQERYITYSRKQILDYMENRLMTTANVEEQLEIIDDVGSVRYIRSVHEYKISNNSPYVYMKLNTYIYNAFIVHNFITNYDDFQSLQITLPLDNLIHKCCADILDKLILTPIDTAGGISVVCE